jgi:DNA-binding CsgD family transcriptional regulator
VSRRLIGREAELAEVELFLDGVATGSRLEIEGEVGIGKTALWSEACERGRRRGYRVLVSRPAELETGLTYSALGDLLDDVLDEALLTVAQPRRRALERALLRVDDEDEPPEPHAVSLALRDALRSLGVEPLVVAIDDVQWLDRSSRAALAFALRRLGDAPIGVLTTRRAGDDASQTLPVGQSILLGPLGEADVDDLVRTTLGASLPRHALHEVFRVSEGNSLFALELAREALRRGGDARGTAALAVPPSLRALLGNRVAELPVEVREALLVVAAASQPTVSLVEAVLGSRERAYDVLAEAAAAEILLVERGRLRFRHPLLASVVYGDAAPIERRRVHVALSEATDDIEEHAYHLARATDLPDPAVAVALDAAAERALGRGAPAAAAWFAEEALRLTRAEDRDAAARRTAVAADALWNAGETGRARRLLEALTATLPRGLERARALRHLARARAFEEGFIGVMEPLEHALAEVGDDMRLRAALERDIAFAIMNIGDVRHAEPHAAAAVATAAALADAELTEDARAIHDSVRFLLGFGVPADLAARARRLALDEPDQDAHSGFLARTLILACLLKWSDDLAGARAVLERLQRHVAEREEEGPLVPVMFHLGELECWAGNLGAATAIAREVEAGAGRLGPGLVAQASYLSALVAALQGDSTQARAAAARGLELAERGHDVRLIVRNLKVLGFVALSLGEPAAAHPPLARAADLAAAHGYVDPGFFRLAADAIEAFVGVEDLTRAERDAVALEELGKRLGRAWAVATGARSRALVAAARGERDAAVAALNASLAAHDRVDDPLEKGRTLLALGSVYRQARRKRDARAALDDSVALFEALPAPLWAERARREAARIGGRVPAGDVLTETERRIAHLVAEGRSNGEVAKALFLSRKTVEWNLSNVYRKLGVRSRAELARRHPDLP